MRILLMHVFYRDKGGEDAVFNQERSLLSLANEIQDIKYYNKSGIRGASQFLFSIWNVVAARKLKNTLLEYKPDVIHIHNLHFAAGPLLIRVAKKAGIPVVVTLHNFRLICPSATLLLNGGIFIDSINRSFPWKAIRHGIYRNSIVQTFWLAFIIWFHKKIGTWQMVDKFIVLTSFAKTQFLSSTLNIQESKFVVKPNFVNEFVPPEDNLTPKDHFLFIGRLSVEKGIEVLLQAFKLSGLDLIIAGDGPFKEQVETAASAYSNIKYVGSLNSREVYMAMRECSALIFPSIWYEGMPMTIIEALSCGTMIVASNIGAMASIITNDYDGYHFEVGQVQDLIKRTHDWMLLPDSRKNEFRSNAHNTYLKSYTSKKNYQQLLNIYTEIIKS